MQYLYVLYSLVLKFLQIPILSVESEKPYPNHSEQKFKFTKQKTQKNIHDRVLFQKNLPLITFKDPIVFKFSKIPRRSFTVSNLILHLQYSTNTKIATNSNMIPRTPNHSFRTKSRKRKKEKKKKRSISISEFQESLPPLNSREESQERRRKRSSRESDSRERLTDRCPENSAGLELSTSIADCCCIGPRSRLPLPRVPPSTTIAVSSSPCVTGGGGVGGVGGGGGGVSCGQSPFPGPPTSSNSRVAGVEQPATLTTPTTTSAQPTLVNSNNNRGMLQMSVGNSTGQQHHQAQSSAALTAAVPSVSTSTSFNTSTAVPTLQSVSVPRQLAQWTKHQTLKLQVFSGIFFSTSC